jgi:twitching motility protein PilT
VTIVELLKTMVSKRASDVHLHVGSAPTGRVDGKLVPFANRTFTPDDTKTIARSLLTAEQWEEFEYRHELETALALSCV